MCFLAFVTAFLMYRSQSQGLTLGVQVSLSFLSCVELSVVCFRLIVVSIRLFYIRF